MNLDFSNRDLSTLQLNRLYESLPPVPDKWPLSAQIHSIIDDFLLDREAWWIDPKHLVDLIETAPGPYWSITVTGNPGTGEDSPVIATSKGWTVIGS